MLKMATDHYADES